MGSDVFAPMRGRKIRGRVVGMERPRFDSGKIETRRAISQQLFSDFNSLRQMEPQCNPKPILGCLKARKPAFEAGFFHCEPVTCRR